MKREEETGFNWWLVIGGLVVLGLVWYFGFQPFRAPQAPYTPPPAATLPPAVSTPTPAAGVGYPSEETGAGVLLEAPIPANPDESTSGQVACGDFSCDASERCDSCAQDCGCAGDEYCNRVDGLCYAIEK